MVMLANSRTRLSAVWLVILLIPSLKAWTQTNPDSAAPAGTPVRVSAIIQPALNDVQSAVSGLTISRWKAPAEVKNAAQQNAASIQRDLTSTLPGLITQSDAAPGAVPPAFSVYRNIDALYDVLLRVYGTASLAANESEADSLFSALQKLEAARAQLGDTILSTSQDHEAQLVKLQAALKAATATPAPQPPAKASVVDDGPAPASSPKKKKKPAAKPPATSTPSNATPAGPNG